jgi:VanZ family protein
MTGVHRQTVFRAGFYACAAGIAVLAFYPLDGQPVTGSDKLNHLIAFAVLAGLADGAYPNRRRDPMRWAPLVAYGLFIEVVQAFLPYRHFSLADLAADALGVLLYAGAARLVCVSFAAARRDRRDIPPR